jgi:hypothetical protein
MPVATLLARVRSPAARAALPKQGQGYWRAAILLVLALLLLFVWCCVREVAYARTKPAGHAQGWLEEEGFGEPARPLARAAPRASGGGGGGSGSGQSYHRVPSGGGGGGGGGGSGKGSSSPLSRAALAAARAGSQGQRGAVARGTFTTDSDEDEGGAYSGLPAAMYEWWESEGGEDKGLAGAGGRGGAGCSGGGGGVGRGHREGGEDLSDLPAGSAPMAAPSRSRERGSRSGGGGGGGGGGSRDRKGRDRDRDRSGYKGTRGNVSTRQIDAFFGKGEADGYHL